jgi:muramidase (phage lysozyme)
VIGTGAAAAGIGMYMQSQGNKQDKELQKSDPEYGKKPSPMKSMLDFGSRGGLGFAGGGMIPLAKAFAGGGEATQLQPFEGGYVDDSTGVTVTGAGADTQATVLQPGEIVFSKKAVDYWGADRLLYMNKIGGGTNIPKFVNNVQLAQGGGMIGGMMRGIGRLFGTGSAPTPKMDFKPSWHGPAPTYEHKSNEVQAFLRALKVAEGTTKSKNSYDTVFGGQMMPVRQMTVKELLDTQMTDRLPQRFGGGKAPWPKGSVASGAYQFMPNTLKQLMKMKVLRPSDKMTPENQDRAAWALAKFRGVTLQQLKTQGMSRAIMNKLAPEWASIPNLEGKSNYGQPVKSPELLKETYQKGLNLGQQTKMQLPGPPVANSKISFVELPPIVQQAGQKVASSVGTKVPQFTPPDNVSARINASIYGIA